MPNLYEAWQLNSYCFVLHGMQNFKLHYSDEDNMKSEEKFNLLVFL